MFDERALKGGAEGMEQVAGFKYLCDVLISRNYRYRSLISFREVPLTFGNWKSLRHVPLKRSYMDRTGHKIYWAWNGPTA